MPLRAWQAAAAVGVLAFTAHVGVDLGGPGSDQSFNRWLYSGLLSSQRGPASLEAWSCRRNERPGSSSRLV